MAEAVRKVEIEEPTVRRFELPDLSRHGGWLMARLLKQFTHLNERTVSGWLRAVLYQPDTLFLYQDHAVAMAQIVKSHSLDLKPVVQERFVWVEDPSDKEQVTNAVIFYDHFLLWAKRQFDVDVIIVEESSDVPHDMIGERLKRRLFERKQTFVKV